MDWSTLLSIGNFGLNLYSSYSNAQRYGEMRDIYNAQAEKNRAIGEWNAKILMKAGFNNMTASLQQSSKILDRQKVEFSRRNMYLDGSAEFVMQETYGEALKQANSAYENAQVASVNAVNAGDAAASANLSAANQAMAGQMQSYAQLARNFMEFGRSAFQDSNTGRGVMGNPGAFQQPTRAMPRMGSATLPGGFTIA